MAINFSIIRKESTMTPNGLMPIFMVCAFLPHTNFCPYPPVGDHHKFRSPAEFLPHAAWLIAGKTPGCCRCKYCNPGRGKFSQYKLNNQLKDGYEAAVNERKREEYWAARDGKPYMPDDQPLVKVFLRCGSYRQVLEGSNSHDKSTHMGVGLHKCSRGIPSHESCLIPLSTPQSDWALF